jgi:putative transcriptional regulator
VKKSRILEGMRETTHGLVRFDAMDKQTLRQFDILALPRIRDLSPKQIRAIRARTRVSQAVFAAMLNTSVSTIQKWEIGEKRPSGPSLKLLNLIQRRGVEAVS